MLDQRGPAIFAIDFFRHDTGDRGQQDCVALFRRPAGQCLSTVRSRHMSLYWEGTDLKLGRRDEGTASFDPPIVLSCQLPGVNGRPGRSGCARWSLVGRLAGVRRRAGNADPATLPAAHARMASALASRSPSDPQSNVDPSLALTKSMVSMSWTRSTAAAATIMLGTSSLGIWTSAEYSKNGTFNTRSDVATNGGVRYLVWERDGEIVESDDAERNVSAQEACPLPAAIRRSRFPTASRQSPGRGLTRRRGRHLCSASSSIGWASTCRKFPSYAAEVLSTGHQARVIYFREVSDIAHRRAEIAAEIAGRIAASGVTASDGA